MKKYISIFIVFITLISCNSQNPTQFSEDALNDTFVSLDGNSIAFKDILKEHEGKTILIDIWASWCGDCIKGMPKLKALQKEYGDVVYVFLSLDRSHDAWKKGIKKYIVKGNHYFIKSGWEGPFGEFVDLDWIPRYMVVDATGNIKLFKAVEADDKHIKEIFINT